jgi:hypothetical protein
MSMPPGITPLSVVCVSGYSPIGTLHVSFCDFFKKPSLRLEVDTAVIGVSCAVHKSFRSLDEAISAYSNVFHHGRLVVVSLWGELMGPPDRAVYISDSSDDEAEEGDPQGDSAQVDSIQQDGAQAYDNQGGDNQGGDNQGGDNQGDGNQGDDNQDGRSVASESSDGGPDVDNKWEFTESEMADLAALDYTFNVFYQRREE